MSTLKHGPRETIRVCMTTVLLCPVLLVANYIVFSFVVRLHPHPSIPTFLVPQIAANILLLQHYNPTPTDDTMLHHTSLCVIHKGMYDAIWSCILPHGPGCISLGRYLMQLWVGMQLWPLGCIRKLNRFIRIVSQVATCKHRGEICDAVWGGELFPNPYCIRNLPYVITIVLLTLV